MHLERFFSHVWYNTDKKTQFEEDRTMNWAAKRLCTEHACFSTYGSVPKVGHWWLWTSSSSTIEVESCIPGPVAPAGNGMWL